MAITAMPILSRLVVTLPTESFAVIDRVLPRSLHLTSLTVLFRDGDVSKVQFIEELTISEVPITTELGFDLIKAARCLSRGLTSLDLSFCTPKVEHNLAAAALQGLSMLQLEQLAPLTRLQQLRLNGPLGGQQHVPPILSTITSLTLQGQKPLLTLKGLSSLVLLRELRLQYISEWPSGLGSLHWLTHLELRAGRALDLPADYALPPQLRHLEVSTSLEVDRNPIVLPSLSSLSRLEHLHLVECDVEELLYRLPHLSCLTLLHLTYCCIDYVLGCDGGRLQLSHLAALQHLHVEKCRITEAPAGLCQLSALTELVLEGNIVGEVYDYGSHESDDGAMDEGDRPAKSGLLGAMYGGCMTGRDLDEDDRIWLGPTSPAATLSRLPALQRLSIRRQHPYSGHRHEQNGSKSARRLVQQQLHSFLSMRSPTLANLTYLQLRHDGGSSEQLPWSGLSACMASMPSLRHLHVMQPCPYYWPKGVGKLQHLTHLSLCCVSSAPPCARSPFPLALPRLRTLRLGCKEVGFTATSRQPLPFPDKLRTVCPQLSHLACRFVNGPALVRALPDLAGLTEVDLRQCDLSGAPLDLGQLRSLQRARFQGCRISQPPVGLSILEALTKLELQGNDLSYASKRVVRGQAGSHVDVEI
ncbi:hypothetical protein N2152v2_011139 [Parachlorella kessleri]